MNKRYAWYADHAWVSPPRSWGTLRPPATSCRKQQNIEFQEVCHVFEILSIMCLMDPTECVKGLAKSLNNILMCLRNCCDGYYHRSDSAKGWGKFTWLKTLSCGLRRIHTILFFCRLLRCLCVRYTHILLAQDLYPQNLVT